MRKTGTGDSKVIGPLKDLKEDKKKKEKEDKKKDK